MRPGIEVRPAQPGDLNGLVELCLTARAESAVGPQLCSPDAADLAHQLGALATAPGGTVLVGLLDEVPVGMALGRVVGPNPFTDETSLSVETLYVSPDHRRRGVGHALMAGVVDVADEVGAEHVYAAPIPGARGMQRFFVRLGFAPAAAHRVASTAALQRRLGPDGGASARRTGSRGLEDLIARRRQSRAVTGEIPVVAMPEPQAQESRRSISRQVRRAVQTRRDLESSTAIS
ncbi:MAG TPA: GNAT family N-acetyltransferase [Actinotalea sp.]|nr:GNAT family N-acetyltransferase [Actinotalea sp.]